MERKAMTKLIEWKNSTHRKPLILKGARQVGKSHLMDEFGARCYENFVHLNFDEDEELHSVFQNNKNPHRIVELLSMISGERILPERTLLILDEIQECPAALGALKYFCEKAPEYHVVAAGSLLGTLLSKGGSFPVGKVNLLYIYPMDFEEFLMATNEGLHRYYDAIHIGASIEEIFHNRLMEAYRYYLIIGGMPECVASWAQEKDPVRIDTIHQELVTLYEGDFGKHNGQVNAGRILLSFRSIVAQLSKSNEKFIYGVIREGARAREFEVAVEWLVSAGLVNRIYNVSKPLLPLEAYKKLNQFKLFLFDTGILSHMAKVPNRSILLDGDYQFKGPLTENYIIQQMMANIADGIYYYAEQRSEIDALWQREDEIFPIEIKGGVDKSAPSFKRYIAEREPARAIRFSGRGYRIDGNIVNVPLYLACKVDELI